MVFSDALFYAMLIKVRLVCFGRSMCVLFYPYFVCVFEKCCKNSSVSRRKKADASKFLHAHKTHSNLKRMVICISKSYITIDLEYKVKIRVHFWGNLIEV